MQLKEAQVETVNKIKENSQNAKEGGIVFFGDSIIEFWNIENMHLENAYNCGIRQSSTKELLEFQEFAVKPFAPKTVVLLGGANDLSDENHFELSFIVENLEKMINIFTNDYSVEKIILIEPLPVDENRKATSCRTNKVMKELDELVHDMAIKYSNVKTINCFNELLDDNQQLKDEYTLDGIHLNDKGCKIIQEKLIPLL